MHTHIKRHEMQVAATKSKHSTLYILFGISAKPSICMRKATSAHKHMIWTAGLIHLAVCVIFHPVRTRNRMCMFVSHCISSLIRENSRIIGDTQTWYTLFPSKMLQFSFSTDMMAIIFWRKSRYFREALKKIQYITKIFQVL